MDPTRSQSKLYRRYFVAYCHHFVYNTVKMFVTDVNNEKNNNTPTRSAPNLASTSSLSARLFSGAHRIPTPISALASWSVWQATRSRAARGKMFWSSWFKSVEGTGGSGRLSLCRHCGEGEAIKHERRSAPLYALHYTDHRSTPLPLLLYYSVLCISAKPNVFLSYGLLHKLLLAQSRAVQMSCDF